MARDGSGMTDEFIVEVIRDEPTDDKGEPPSDD